MPGRINFKPPPDRQALAFLKAKGLKTSFNWKDIYGAEHAYAFTVAKVESLKLLSHFKESLTDAFEQGQTFRDWQKNIEPVIRRSGWMGVQEKIDPLTGELVSAKLGTPRRLRVIFDTNMRQARHAGHWERVQEVKKNLPYLEYRLGPSEEHRKEHAAWDGLVLPVDDAWWDTHHPQNGWGCKCWTRQLTRLQAQKRGVGKAPPLEKRSMVNNRTGEVIEVPKGIDPGFEFNPGKKRMEVANAFTEKAFEEASPELARAAVGNYISSPDILNVMKFAEQALPSGYLSDDLLVASGVQNPLVLMGTKAAKKQLTNHPELLAKDYGSIPDIIDSASEIRRSKDQLLLLHEALDTKYVLVLRSAGDKMFVASLRKASTRSWNQTRKNSYLVLQRK